MVNLYDLADVDENGKMQAKQVYLPKGKTPFVLSQDDVCYYHSQDGDGIATKLVIDEEGKVRNEYVQDDGSTVVGDYVAIDALPGNQVEGISPLYHVSQVDDYPDKMAAVMQISTRMDARELIGALESVSSSISDDLDLDLVDMEGVVRNEPDCMVPWPSAREHAAVLAPWFDMDPDAKLGRDPVEIGRAHV